MNICFIGASGHAYYALDGIQSNEEVNITGICPGSEGENVESLYKIICQKGYSPVLYNNYTDMLNELRPDIVVVNCFFGDHGKVAIQALKMGCHIFIEKPVATTLEELKELKHVHKTFSKQLATMFGFRYSAPFLTVCKEMNRGAIGELRILNAQKSYKLGSRPEFFTKRESYGGTIPWVGSHAIDWIYWLSGEKFISVYASHSRKANSGHGDLEATALCQFNLTNEVFASVTIDYLRPSSALTHADDRIRIVGTKGILEVREGNVYLTNGEKEGTQLLNLVDEENIFADFLKQVKGEGACMISAEDSFYVTEACIRARISADENRVVTF